MKHYELLFILKPTLTEEEVKAKVDFVKEVITKNGGEIATVVEMGTRKLAYTIKKYERGTYFVIYYKAPPALLAELTRNVRITIKKETREPRAPREPRAEKVDEQTFTEE